MKINRSINARIGGVVTLLAVALLQIVPFTNVSAAQITSRSLTLVAGTTDGGSKPGGNVNHLYSFTVPGGSSVGSIQFKYCTTAADAGAFTCTTPVGLSTTSATLSSQTGATGFTINNATNGTPYLSRSAASIATNTPVTYQLNGVVNPSTPNKVFYVRITTYASTDTTGTPIDNGTVAASTANPIILSGTMPESLVFCTADIIGSTSGVPDCSTALNGTIAFNQLFSPTDTATATSQMAASTNAGSGYAISVNGPTLTSGANTINPMTTPSATIHGLGQFGMNLKANTTATSTSAIGAEVAPVSTGTTYRGQAINGYDTVDTFKFNSGENVANSASGGAGGSNAQIYTISYIANVPGNQPAGTYATTLTYICTPTF